MNNVILIGRLANDPNVSTTNGENPTTMARFTLAVNRAYGKEQASDFIRVVTFGKSAEFVEKYFRKGIRIAAEGEWRTGSYTDKDGRTQYTNDMYANRLEFADGKPQAETKKKSVDDFVNIPDIDDDAEGLPFQA